MPAPPPAASFDRALALAATPSALQGFWLEVKCCGGSVMLPLRQMAREPRRARSPLADIVLKLRCKRCRRRPVTVALFSDPKGRSPQLVEYPSGWRILLWERG